MAPPRCVFGARSRSSSTCDDDKIMGGLGLPNLIKRRVVTSGHDADSAVRTKNLARAATAVSRSSCHRMIRRPSISQPPRQITTPGRLGALSSANYASRLSTTAKLYWPNTWTGLLRFHPNLSTCLLFRGTNAIMQLNAWRPPKLTASSLTTTTMTQTLSLKASPWLQPPMRWPRNHHGFTRVTANGLRAF